LFCLGISPLVSKRFDGNDRLHLTGRLETIIVDYRDQMFLWPFGELRLRRNMHTIKPIDNEVIVRAAHETGRLLTLEEHSIIGGLGSAVSEVVAELGVGRVVRLGVPDRFCTEIAPYRELLQNCGLDEAGVEATARKFVQSQ
jgi:hypothetical protein